MAQEKSQPTVADLLREGQSLRLDNSGEPQLSPMLEIGRTYEKSRKFNLAVGVYEQVMADGAEGDAKLARASIERIARMYMAEGKLQTAMDLLQRLK